MAKAAALRLVFGGDFAPCGGYEGLIAARGGAVFGAAGAVFAAADLALVNLELPLCAASSPVAKVGPGLWAGPRVLRAAAEAGIGAVTLANNHILDQGVSGLRQTLAALGAAGLGHAGAGLVRAAAEAPLRIRRGGRRISIFAFAEREFNLAPDGAAGAALLDPLRIAPLLARERAGSDALIVCAHGGSEYFPYPHPQLRRLYRFVVEMGADAVIGHHPHVAGAYEVYRGRPIFYSLGNLIFDRAAPLPGWDEGYLVQLDLRFGAFGGVEIGHQLLPYRQSVAGGGVRLMAGAERAALLGRIERMRQQLETRPAEWLAAWEAFVSQRRAQLLIDLFSPLRFRGLRRLLGVLGLGRLLLPGSRRRGRLNLLRCASHHALAVAVLEHSLAEAEGQSAAGTAGWGEIWSQAAAAAPIRDADQEVCGAADQGLTPELASGLAASLAPDAGLGAVSGAVSGGPPIVLPSGAAGAFAGRRR